MRSYLVLTPKNGPDREHRSTIIMTDGFSWLAFLLSWIWLFWHRMWIVGAIALVIQIGSGVLSTMPGFAIGGWLLGFAMNLIVALEGRHLYSQSLQRRGYTLETVVFAQDRSTAEEMYFSNLPQPEPKAMPSLSEWAPQTNTPFPAAAGWQSSGAGLFDHGAR